MSAHFSFCFWLRIRGRGIAISNAEPLFSERYGYRKCVRIFGVKFEWLPLDIKEEVAG